MRRKPAPTFSCMRLESERRACVFAEYAMRMLSMQKCAIFGTNGWNKSLIKLRTFIHISTNVIFVYIVHGIDGFCGLMRT